MNFTIIGGGKTGRALAVYLTSKNEKCLIKTRDAAKAALVNEKGIEAEGALSGCFKAPMTTSMEEAAAFGDVIIIMTVANAHREVAEQLKPLLRKGQRIVVFNSNWGALEFKQVLGSLIDELELIVAETGAQLFVASAKAENHVSMTIKARTSVCATDSSKTAQLIDELKEVFPQFAPAGSIIETTMSTTNPVIHVPLTILNAARAENAQPFRFYADGASQKGVDLVVALDRERIQVAKALGCGIDDVLTGINSFWPDKYDNLFDALTKNPAYIKAAGPQLLDHRYLTEDVPFGIAPIAKIGRLFGIPTPYADAVMAFCLAVFGEELVGGGIEFRREDFE